MLNKVVEFFEKRKITNCRKARDRLRQLEETGTVSRLKTDIYGFRKAETHRKTVQPLTYAAKSVDKLTYTGRTIEDATKYCGAKEINLCKIESPYFYRLLDLLKNEGIETLKDSILIFPTENTEGLMKKIEILRDDVLDDR